MEALLAWLAGPEAVSVHALVGGGGRGKTRLAVEAAVAARADGWIAGFARREDLDVFRGQGCRTEWSGPTLVIVDYAAAKHAAIGAWLRSLVHAAGDGRPPLRLLLLERTGGPGSAWWDGIFGRSDPEGEALRELLSAGAPETVGALADPVERHAVVAAAFEQASGRPAPEASSGLDLSLSEASLGGEPLFWRCSG
jgi:hypothetical protein